MIFWGTEEEFMWRVLCFSPPLPPWLHGFGRGFSQGFSSQRSWSNWLCDLLLQ